MKTHYPYFLPPRGLHHHQLAMELPATHARTAPHGPFKSSASLARPTLHDISTRDDLPSNRHHNKVHGFCTHAQVGGD